MAIHPGNTISLWLNDLATTYTGDSITLSSATVTAAIHNRKGEVILAADAASFVSAVEKFRRVCAAPSTPGWYEAVFEITAGDAELTVTERFVVEATTGAGS